MSDNLLDRIERIRAINVQPGDMLVFDAMDDAAWESLRREVGKIFQGNRILMLRGVEVKVFRPAADEESDTTLLADRIADVVRMRGKS